MLPVSVHATGTAEKGREEDAQQPTAAFPAALHRCRSEAEGAEDQGQTDEA